MSIIKNRTEGYHTKVLINHDGNSVIYLPLNVMYAWLFNIRKDNRDGYYINIGELNGQPGLFLFKREEKET